MKFALLLSLPFLLAAAALPAGAQEPFGMAALSAPNQTSLGIAVVVNDDVISMRDLNERLRMVVVSSQLKDTPETRKRFMAQVVRKMIDEKLQVQEAKRLNIRVTESDIAVAMKRIEQQNKLPDGGLQTFIEQAGINRASLIEQIRADVAWVKVVGQKIRPLIDIGEDEVDEAIERMRKNRGRPESHVLEIFLAVESRDREDEVRRFAERLHQQLRDGANFEAAARQFSNGANAAVGGDIGWVQYGQLNSTLDAALRKMSPGEISRPIRILDGYHILLLRQRRMAAAGKTEETRIALQQIFLPLPPSATRLEVASQTELANTLRQTAEGCKDFERLGRELGSPLSGGLGSVVLEELPPHFRDVVMGLPVGQAGPPIPTDKGLVVLMVCKRIEPKVDQANRNQIADLIRLRRISMLAQRYLRDLRRAAFIDMRV
jgi:peptidyl-prolyl cis-trans isomerase SurA